MGQWATGKLPIVSSMSAYFAEKQGETSFLQI